MALLYEGGVLGAFNLTDALVTSAEYGPGTLGGELLPSFFAIGLTLALLLLLLRALMACAGMRLAVPSRLIAAGRSLRPLVMAFRW